MTKSHVTGWTSDSPTPAQLKEFFDQISTRRITKNSLQDFLRGWPAETYPVSIDYDQSIKAMIKAGDYNWTDSDITAKHFPIKGKGKVEHELELIPFNRSMTSDQVLNEFKARGLEVVQIEDILAFGAKYPEIQREFPVIGLGSVWTRSGGNRRVPYLHGSASERGLRLSWFDGDWLAYCRFLARRK